jgi:hypothetical protein
MLRLNENVEPLVTLVEVGLMVAEREGAVLASKDTLPESGVHVPEMLTVIVCELDLLAVKVVHDTLSPVMVFV